MRHGPALWNKWRNSRDDEFFQYNTVEEKTHEYMVPSHVSNSIIWAGMLGLCKASKEERKSSMLVIIKRGESYKYLEGS